MWSAYFSINSTRSLIFLPANYARDFSEMFWGEFHKYRQNALIDATTILGTGPSLTLISIGRILPAGARLKTRLNVLIAG
jgi:hypothetical protein